ncbi:phosphoribosylaminoimidazolecarboxamide formyltransferase [Chitinispirillales bacterium ANBcel5]|uniref:phosphoribosylaminoimidazolecarboxamide formyltransferase n=1 Tax=Cellulosispirillum alkaliphilum TaxID=3039283 RepID=UPI002A51E61D|nr:phosphoribosylaminoimidazolecarboxamide formyltransferase [Chitinispirillales bacterium ANBcel5]
MNELILRYGCNPHQAPARIFSPDGELPLTVLNGTPGYINLLDALNSWQLVKELQEQLGMVAATSFKHVSPAGAAVAVPLTKELKKAYFVDDMELSDAATAYARARGADRVSSFGDWAAFSSTVDKSAAMLLKREVSDGVIAPDYDPEALEILKTKKGGKFAILQIDKNYSPSGAEVRDVYGICFEQKRNDITLDRSTLENVVSENKDFPESAVRDLILAQVTLKYTQSNSVCFASGGQVIGVGAGQQSRIHCTRLAASKADRWFLRQHNKVLNLQFNEKITRPVRDNAIDQYFEENLTPAEMYVFQSNFKSDPEWFSKDERREWLNLMDGVSLASDAFFPFRDNIDRAQQSGVKYIAQPGGSVRDDAVIEACNEYGMSMAFSSVRLFHH